MIKNSLIVILIGMNLILGTSYFYKKSQFNKLSGLVSEVELLTQNDRDLSAVQAAFFLNLLQSGEFDKLRSELVEVLSAYQEQFSDGEVSDQQRGILVKVSKVLSKE